MASHTIQASLQRHEVYLGIWTNWSQGSITGLTLTTTLRNGGLLIAFLALFVTFTGTCFWTIVSFLVHQLQSRQGPQYTIYHQQQAILRNSDTSAAAFWRLSRLLWAWRRKSTASMLRSSLLPLIMSMITFGAFATAGIFSSRVASSRGGEVLVVGDKCAILDISLFTLQNYGKVQTWLSRRIRSSTNYASTCYTNDSSAESCRTFVRSNIPFQVTREIPCPFPGNDRICRSSNGAIRFDSGLINSQFDLGINSPSSDRFSYRTVTECAPVHNEGFTRIDTSRSPARLQFLYGTDFIYCNGGGKGCSFQHPVEIFTGTQIGNDYTVEAVTYYTQPDGNDTVANDSWRPIPELLVPNADISMIFLSANNIPYIVPVDDPWFSAGHNGSVNVTSALGHLQAYLSDDPARALACTHRYQFCNPAVQQNGTANCTALQGIIEVFKASPQLFSNSKQRAKFLWSATAIMYMASGFPEFVGLMQSGSLLARDSLAGTMQDALPINQWELEVEHWFKFTLADLQRAILDEATGPVQQYAREFHTSPSSAEERAICNNQKIRSDSFTSFNVLGLLLIFSVGGFVILLASFLPAITRRIQRHRRLLADLEWISNDTLQLQRLAHEAVGAGDWEGACDDYPRTQRNDRLAVLDITDKKHPLLKVFQESITHKPRERTSDSAQESLLFLEIPPSSLEISERFTNEVRRSPAHTTASSERETKDSISHD